MKRLIIYGDIHGCLDEFRELRHLIDPRKEDIEVSVGDILNKGPYSLQTLRYIREHKILTVMGNNEEKMIKYYRKFQNGDETLFEKITENEKETLLGMRAEEYEFLTALPYFLKFSNLTVVHGGIPNDLDLSKPLTKEAKKALTLYRFLDRNYNMIPYADFEHRFVFWSDIYDGHEGFVVFGHHPFEQPKISPHAIGIDTGCVYGGALTAIIFEINDEVLLKSYRFEQVPAKKQYWP
ncbi:MAG: hypothetical protein B6D59_00620 [Campylobacteraceae bacterium 4484_4]|nr:MAG: hypothetical protein B6D59_00620 [Campylobacteraceae bacterium 4484_4]